jgi:hypothetical protein
MGLAHPVSCTVTFSVLIIGCFPADLYLHRNTVMDRPVSETDSGKKAPAGVAVQLF